MKVLVTGASSYVGAKVYTDLKSNHDVVGTYYSNRLFDDLIQLDITKKEETIDTITSKKPDVIVHVAANASGSWCDKHQDEAIAINKDGTEHIVEAANSVNAKVIYISSLAVIVKTLYGKTKLAGEDFVKKTKAGYVILRPSLIVGYSPNTTNDRPFNRILKNLIDKTPAVYDNSWKFQPTYLKHISEVIEAVLDKKISGKTIAVAVPEITSRYKLAKDILEPFGIEVTPENKNDASPSLVEKLAELDELGLPKYSYSEMIDCIVQEIKESF